MALGHENQDGDGETGRLDGGKEVNRRTVLRGAVGVAGAAAFAQAGLRRGAAQATPAVVDGRISSGVDGVPDAYTSLPQPFVSVAAPPAAGGEVSTLQVTFQPPIPGRDDNSHWRELETRLGVERLNAQLIPSASYTERLTATVAGGDIPDLTVVITDDAAQNRLILDGAFTDLTPYLTGDALLEFPNLAAFPAYLWKNVAIQGKIYGVPRETFRCGTVLAFRQDWADMLGQAAPENGEGFAALLAGFTKGDPDGDGSQDTWGLGGATNVGGTFSRTFFEYMFRVPNQWRLEADGTLTNAIETEEFAQAVAYMRALHEAGVYHPDVAAMTDAKDRFIGGQFGGFTDGPGGLPGSSNLRGRVADVDPAANVVGLVPVGHDGGAAVTHNSKGFYGIVCIPSRIEDEARIKELLRILDYYAAPFGSEEWLFLRYGTEGTHFTYGPEGQPVLTDTGTQEIGGADLGYLSFPPTVFYYDRPGDAEYMLQMVKEYLAVGIDDPALGIFSETAVEKGGELNQLQIDRVTGIVTGRESLESLSGFIDDWRSRGGDQIREELQAGLAPA